VIKRHAAIGAEMLAGREFPLLEMAERIALTHHERWDGSGYPAGLASEEIPLVGRIVALADVFDALTHDRPYKSAWTLNDASAEIRSQRGRQSTPRWWTPSSNSSAATTVPRSAPSAPVASRSRRRARRDRERHAHDDRRQVPGRPRRGGPSSARVGMTRLPR
jgi:putative two-component system response regulator